MIKQRRKNGRENAMIKLYIDLCYFAESNKFKVGKAIYLIWICFDQIVCKVEKANLC